MKWTLNTLNFKEEIIVQLPRSLMASGASGHVSARLEPHAQECSVATWIHMGPGHGDPTAASVWGATEMPALWAPHTACTVGNRTARWLFSQVTMTSRTWALHRAAWVISGSPVLAHGVLAIAGG